MRFEGRRQAQLLDRCWSIYLWLTDAFVLPESFHIEFPVAVESALITGTLWGMVGFQTKMTYPEQRRVVRLIPGLEKAEFVRLGSLHRNTFIDSPRLLRPTLQFRRRADLFFTGQMIGVEGYLESAAAGLFRRGECGSAAGRAAAPPCGRVVTHRL